MLLRMRWVWFYGTMQKNADGQLWKMPVTIDDPAAASKIVMCGRPPFRKRFSNIF